MRSVLLACCLLVPALAFLGGCDNKKVIMPTKTGEAPKEEGTKLGPPAEGDSKKGTTKP